MTEISSQWLQRRLSGNSTTQQDQRSRFQRDKARVLHSAAFRRLQSKTQVLGIGLNDFYRTRLTHSIESAQIGSGINAQLRHHYPKLAFLFDDQLIEALCLAHDIGHPPFGHGGEVALNYMMRQHGGFEGNGQTFRILATLEPYTEHHGMNLTRRTLLGVLKYPVRYSDVVQRQLPNDISVGGFLNADSWHPPKCIFDQDNDILSWVLAPLSSSDRSLFATLKQQPRAEEHGRCGFKSLDCSIMELADDIAYSVHDLEDSIVLGIITQAQWQQQVVEPLSQADSPYSAEQFNDLTKQLFSPDNFRRKKAIGALVNGFVTAISVQQNQQFAEPLLSYNAVLPRQHHALLSLLKQFVFRNVIRLPEVQRLEFKGQHIVMALFSAFASEPERLLPSGTQQKWRQAQQNDGSGYRVLSDYLSGMTDEFAARLHDDLFAGRFSYSEIRNRE
ncbi:anti-phage deoxyguanosine triphosphatase [Ferrimonas lipolytica]|uniref:Deoxyguanosinetriphosphate triphosphohydrolase-like protein n=1 Tax=Ferrimonas lipolytica TaxID=2724191 RepID=A0A6H1UC42_9GAMM|nr:anti-phage deoxyguanosine triphosphatase [Ferrimonas lipolytica]QIZ76150.1 deoxyguanosinetriphosphate triphosphohydrolase family protein [Ferrimonas lipolytica]